MHWKSTGTLHGIPENLSGWLHQEARQGQAPATRFARVSTTMSTVGFQNVFCRLKGAAGAFQVSESAFDFRSKPSLLYLYYIWWLNDDWVNALTLDVHLPGA